MDLTFQETDSKESHPTRQQVLGEELFRLRHPKCKGQEVEEPRVPAAEEAWRSLGRLEAGRSAGGWHWKHWKVGTEACPGGGDP